ncbi:hypothetical protein CsSME_00039154 [Camellia sinensis var. sinensis]
MAVNFALSIGAKIAEYLVYPIGRQFGYVIFYKSNLDKLREEVNKLEERSGALQLSVDAARRNGWIIGPDVERWLERVKECSNKASEILKNETEANKGCRNGWCPNLKSRHSVGRKVTKKAEEVAKLHGEGSFTTVSYPAPPPGIESESTEGIKSFESRRRIINEVVQALKDDRFHMIGICGMGGVGKTTMVKQVAKRVKKEKSSAVGGAGKTPMVKEVTKSANEEQLFDEVVIALVSQSPDEKKIQAEIADKLGLRFEEESASGRADRLRESLRRKRILLILDDVWKRLELNDIGIPYGDGHGGCKILLTSRFVYVCDDMGAEKKFTVEALDKEEAWNLFKDMAGISNDTSTEFYSTQKAVAEECGGLPVAIKAVARALKGKGEPSWDSALGQLQRSIIKSIRGVEDQIFKSLELSYNSLESKEAQKVFLFCSLYPEDFDIPIEDLVRYGIGLESFEGIDTVSEARQKVHDFVDDLKKCYLLMDSEEKECVKMHDVIRDVALSIASGEEHSFMVRYDKALEDWPQKHRLKNYIVISLKLNGMHGLPGNLEFPKLQLLKLEFPELQVQETPDCFCQGMKELRVLALSNFPGSLPTSLRCLTNLRTLSLSGCPLDHDDVSVIGALENLEMFSFAGSYITELPKEIIGHLGRLKVLDLLNCTVERIYPGVLSSLSMLEELYVGNSIQTMDGLEERTEMTNAIIAEVASLSHLVALDIVLFILPRDWVIDKVKRFNITVYPSSGNDYREPNYRLPNRLELRSADVTDLRDSSSLKMLSQSTKILELDSVKGLKNILSDLKEYSFEQLTKLTLKKCDDFKGIICHGQLLDFLPEVTQSSMGPTPLKWFGNLKSIFFWKCAKMENVFSLPIARNLMHLETIEILDCHLMEVIVSNEGGEHEIAVVATDKIEFPKLKKLWLLGLPSFTAFCKAMNAIELPQLEDLFLREIPKLGSLCLASAVESNYDAYIQPLFDNKVNLTSLERLYVDAMDNLIEIWPGELEAKLRLRRMIVHKCHWLLNILFPSNLMKAMQSLEILVVQDCQSVEVAFGIEGLIVREDHQDILFPSLIDVRLRHLPKLIHVWKDNLSGIQGFENLTSLNIKGCGSLRYVFSSSISKLLVKLQEIEVTECRVMEVIIDEEPKIDDEVATNILIFPQLNTLKLRDLPNLRSFCLQAYMFERSLLKTVEVINCPNMKALPSAFKHMQEPQTSNVQKANFLTSTQHHLLDGKVHLLSYNYSIHH